MKEIFDSDWPYQWVFQVHCFSKAQAQQIIVSLD